MSQNETTPPEDCCDVYLGRGGENNKKRQASLYRVLVTEKFEEYSRTLPNKKRFFAWENIIVPIQKNGGKFFVKSRPGDDSHGWKEAKTDQVFKAVMQALRDRKRSSTNLPSSSPVMSPPQEEASGGVPDDSCMSMGTSLRQTTNLPSSSPVMSPPQEETSGVPDSCMSMGTSLRQTTNLPSSSPVMSPPQDEASGVPDSCMSMGTSVRRTTNLPSSSAVMSPPQEEASGGPDSCMSMGTSVRRTTNLPSSSPVMSPPQEEASGMPDSCMSMGTSLRRTTDNETGTNPAAVAVITSSFDETRIYGMNQFRCHCCHAGDDDAFTSSDQHPPCRTTRMLQHLQELVSSLRRENVALHQAFLEVSGGQLAEEDTDDGGD